ncbi:MAG: thiosulfate oxidation carrier complex protein SoxZ [Acidobacteria bacterium]|nr:thiosulfate oxidation carrier complex protein SoxZ [Acidobacteriota bacterium]
MFRVLISFFLLATAGAALFGEAANGVDALNAKLSELLAGARSSPDPEHTPVLKAPRIVEAANEVMVTVSVPLTGDDKHYIRRLVLIDENSVVKVKYVASFAPQVRPAEVTASIKMAKTSQIKAIAECSLHGKWMAVSETIHVGIGGCGAGQEPSRHIPGDVLRVRFRDEDRLVRMNLLFRHPMVSGYVMTADGRVSKQYEPFFLKHARVLHKGQVLAEFELGPGMSENPQIALLLPRLGSEPVHAEATNNVEQKFTLLARMPQ